MFKKRISIMIVIFIGLGLVISPGSFADAESIQQNDTIQVTFTLDESLVDKPIAELKNEDIIIGIDMNGRFIVFLIAEDGQEKMQVITRNEALQLGYIENIVHNLPQNVVMIIEKDTQHHFIVTMIDQHGNDIKQVITEDEAIQLGYIADVANHVFPNKDFHIEKDQDGRYVITLMDQDGLIVKQVITEEEALQLGFDENIKSPPQEEKSISIEEDKVEKAGLPVPETATHFYNMLLGGVLLMIGLVLLFARRKKLSDTFVRT